MLCSVKEGRILLREEGSVSRGCIKVANHGSAKQKSVEKKRKGKSDIPLREGENETCTS